MTPQGEDGPTLQTYVETRFNLLTESLKDLSAAQSGALGAAIESLKSSLAAADLRYQQRFDAQSDALKAALDAAKELVKTSFDASEKAIAKAEVNAEGWRANANEWRAAMVDREARFALRSETETEFRSIRLEMASLKESRAGLAGESSGNRRVKDDTKSYIAVAISIIFLLLALATFIYARFGIRG